MTNAQGKWKKHQQNGFGNVEKVTEPNPLGGADLETNYTYYRFNQMLTVTVTMMRAVTTQTRTFVYYRRAS